MLVLEVSVLLLLLLGGGVLWFVANQGSDTVQRTGAAESAAAVSVKLAWDRSPSPKVTGYRILYGYSSRNYTGSSSVGNEATATLSNLKRGTRYFMVVLAVDGQGNESAPSNELEVLTPN